MGLDILAYRKLTPAAAGDEGDTELHVNPAFQGRADDIVDGQAYYAEECEDIISCTYGSYNRWRDELAKIAGYPLDSYREHGVDWPSHCTACWGGQPGPFSELINFSDCEGVIGTAVSEKLAHDFADYQSAADAHPDDHFKSQYAAMRKGFEMARDGGAVKFF